MIPTNYEPSDAELDILQAIWDLEPVGVREVYEHITLSKKVGYTTVLKQMQRLTEKGVLLRKTDSGVHLYTASIAATVVKQQIAQKILDAAFKGSALDMMMHALGNQTTSKEEILAIKAWLDNFEPSSKGQ